MLPLSEHSHTCPRATEDENMDRKKSKEAKNNEEPPFYFGWPTDVAEIHIPEEQGAFLLKGHT